MTIGRGNRQGRKPAPLPLWNDLLVIAIKPPAAENFRMAAELFYFLQSSA
jgi:hypothetical protein